MELGILARTFDRDDVEQTLAAVSEHGLQWMQFKLPDPSLLDQPQTERRAGLRKIKQAVDDRGLAIAALSATYNMAHPDPSIRRAGMNYLEKLSQAAVDLGTHCLTLCTGTRDPDNMWKHHPDNRTPEAWEDMLASVEEALERTQDSGVILGFEPEYHNVVCSAQAGRTLLDTMESTRLKVIMDAANILLYCEPNDMDAVLTEAFDLLGDDLVLVHGKDFLQGHTGDVPFGQGMLDVDLYLSLIEETPYQGPFILHGFAEEDAAASIEFARRKLQGRGKGSHFHA